MRGLGVVLVVVSGCGNNGDPMAAESSSATGSATTSESAAATASEASTTGTIGASGAEGSSDGSSSTGDPGGGGDTDEVRCFETETSVNCYVRIGDQWSLAGLGCELFQAESPLLDPAEGLPGCNAATDSRWDELVCKDLEDPYGRCFGRIGMWWFPVFGCEVHPELADAPALEPDPAAHNCSPSESSSATGWDEIGCWDLGLPVCHGRRGAVWMGRHVFSDPTFLLRSTCEIDAIDSPEVDVAEALARCPME